MKSGEDPSIHVRLRDADSGQIIGESDVPLSQLPASFTDQTTLHLGSEDWNVVSADPPSAEEFGRTGQVELRIRRPAFASSTDLLYSLPTICGAIGSVSTQSAGADQKVLEIHEDDWRQTEFIGEMFREDFEAELASVQRVWEQYRKPNGFEACHMRRRIARPLAGVGVTLEELRRAIADHGMWAAGVIYQTDRHLVAGSWAVDLSCGMWLYGQQENGVLVCLCSLGEPKNPESPEIAALAEFSSVHKLWLLDWCSCRSIPPSGLG